MRTVRYELMRPEEALAQGGKIGGLSAHLSGGGRGLALPFGTGPADGAGQSPARRHAWAAAVMFTLFLSTERSAARRICTTWALRIRTSM